MKKSALFFLLLLMWACTPEEKKPDARLNGVFMLTHLQSGPIDGDNLPKGFPTIDINLNDSVVSGHSSCNQIRGMFLAKDDGLYFDKMVTTKMYCEGDNVEPEFLDALTKARKYRFEEGKMELLDEGGNFLAGFKIL